MADQIHPLAEHQAPPDVTQVGPTGYEPTAEEQKAIRLVMKLFNKSKQHRKKYDEKWLDNYKMFRGKQWLEQRPSYRHSEVVNFIFQTIQSVVPQMTDSRPRIEYLPQEPMDMELAQILSEVAQSDWEKGNWLFKLTEMIYDSHFYGTAIGEICFDPELEQGLGAIDFRTKDPFYCFPDPNAEDFVKNEKCRFVIMAEPTDVEIVKRKYPDKKDFIKPDLIDLMQGDRSELDQVRFVSPVDNHVVIEGRSAEEMGHKDQCLKITCYVYDDEVMEEESDKITSDGSTPVTKEYTQKLKYPNGRKICVANGVLLDDGPNEYDDGEFPYIRLVNYMLPREFWGMSEVDQLASPQKIFNKLISFTLDTLTLMGNPIWVVDTTAGIDTDNLVNRPGLVVEKEPNSEVRREAGTELQPYVLQLIDRFADWFQEVSGRTDVTQGAAPAGVTAASAITALQEAAQTRTRQKSRNLDSSLQRFGQLYKNRVFQCYDTPRIFRLTQNPSTQKYFKMYVEKFQDEYGQEQKKVSVREYGPDGQMSMDSKEYILRGDFDVRVTTGSSLPFAKKERTDMALQLFDRGIVDPEEVLNAMDYPNKEKVLLRVQQQQAMQQQAAVQGGQAGAAPQGAAPAA